MNFVAMLDVHQIAIQQENGQRASRPPTTTGLHRLIELEKEAWHSLKDWVKAQANSSSQREPSASQCLPSDDENEKVDRQVFAAKHLQVALKRFY
ncbi:Uu.00g126770.m01.CDS01 [Anthostomella pinea]|uniref:Uu.00g126770.m01.CDS01 n=1 Tax=Anthostomella pinea TaxID=933095 RepID=A0AAI8VI23_9PEZI|nr:Uu.00g126770.m01.CDS01 [Anthostomella pinea]